MWFGYHNGPAKFPAIVQYHSNRTATKKMWLLKGGPTRKLETELKSHGTSVLKLKRLNPIQPRGGGDICPHPAQTHTPIKNQWMEILIIFVYS